MTDEDREMFRALMFALGHAYSEKVSHERVEIYFSALADLPIGVVRRAAGSCLQSIKFFPRPAEIREAAAGGTADDQAMHAWLALNVAIPRVGRYSSLLIRDGALAAAIQSVFGGWPGVVQARGRLEEPAWQGKRREFLAAYALAQRSNVAIVSLTYLAGQNDALNLERRAAWLHGPDEVFNRGADVWVLEGDGALRELRVPCTSDGRPNLLEAERLLALPASQRRALPAPALPDVPPKTREEFMRELARFTPPRPKTEHGATAALEQVAAWREQERTAPPEPAPAAEAPAAPVEQPRRLRRVR